MLDYFIPLGFILLGVIAVALYVITMALRDALHQITEMNKQLLVLLGTRDGGEAVGRALVASSRAPVKHIPGVADGEGKKENGKEPPGYRITVGNH